MRRSHRIQSQLVFQNIRILLLHGFRHRVSHIRIALVTVKSSDLNLASVQIEAFHSEDCLSESYRINSRVQYISVQDKIRLQFVKCRVLDVPQFNASRVK